MDNAIKEIFSSHGIELFGAIPLSLCRVTREYKIKKAGFESLDSLYAIVFAVPYLAKAENRNISAYAVPRDYHLYFKELFAKMIPSLEEKFKGHRFASFADDSPIDERDAAARVGLGILGDNGLLITEKYSSFVFLGEIITDLPLECEVAEPKNCEGCGSCKRICPMGEIGVCLSALTQKKGELEEGETAAIKKYGTAWGCDACQMVCPHTVRALKNGTIYTDVEFFKTNLIPHLTTEILDGMSDEDFGSRAYSWRGRKTIRRNLEIIEK